MTSLQGKTIAIVGAAGGLGRAVAEHCARAGANLSLCDSGSDPDGSGQGDGRLGELEAALKAGGTTVHADGRSITGVGAAERFVRETVEHVGTLDGLVFAAGVQRERPLLRMTDTDFDAVVSLQILTAMTVCREAGKVMGEAKAGSIILVGGSAAMFGAQRQSAQGAASAAMAGFCRGAALDLRRHGVRINMVAALAKTRVTEQLPMFQSIRGDSMTAHQVAQTVGFLLSDASSHVSGEVLGAAGSRVYGIRLRETPGYFFEGEFNEEDVAGAFAAAVRP